MTQPRLLPQAQVPAQPQVPPAEPPPPAGAAEPFGSHSGELVRPIQAIRRKAVGEHNVRTELERYKLSLRKYAPVQKGRRGLPWPCQSHCLRCDRIVASQFVYDEDEDRVYLEFRCPACGDYRQPHHDVLFVKNQPGHTRHQPQKTYRESPIRPLLQHLPRTVETLCPECSCNILGRYYVKDTTVYMEKTCPEHGYFRDKINTDVNLYLRGTRRVFEDERGVYDPQVTEAYSCPSDCGLCNQHHSTSCLAQIDLSNRCNLTCPVCFASANQAGYVAEPSYEMVVEMLQNLRDQRPHPATAIQFTGGEPTLHADFFSIIRQANRMGFSHVQAATNGIAFANREFAERSAQAGLHTLYLQFDGLDDRLYKKLRAQPLLEKKLACIENCRDVGLKVCLVPTIVKGQNDDQVGEIFRFAVNHAEVISAVSYQPVAFTGRITHRDLEAKRYTLGDLAHDLAAASGADLSRDFFPLSVLTPMCRIMQLLDGKPKIRPSCHSDCAFGTYFFVTPDHQAVPIPKLFDVFKLFDGFNELHKDISPQRDRANRWDTMRIAAQFFKAYRWRRFDRRISPFTFIRALRGLTDKSKGRGHAESKNYRTLMAAGMHFMDRYNYDMERIRRCVIQYSTPDGVYPFCTINGGPTYRPFIEKMIAQPNDQWQAENPDKALRPSSHPNALMPWAGRYGLQHDEAEEWLGGGVHSDRLRRVLHAGRLADPEPAVPEPDHKGAFPTDGYVTSTVYARQARRPARADGNRDETPGPAGAHAAIDYHHPLEDYLGRWYMRKLLGYLSRKRPGRKTVIEEIITSYADPAATLWQRLKYWPLHRFIRRLKGGVTDQTFRRRVAEHTSTVRGLVVTARSLAEFGLTLPQRFSCPLIIVWNFTNRCNLKCRHCYQDSEHRRLSDELTLAEKLHVVDDLGEHYVPMIAFAGGEPTICPDLLPVLHRCREYGIHTTIATHGGTMTPQLAARLAQAGVKYVEVSLDSVHPDRHDAFRGQPGMWQRTVRGMQNVVKQEGLRLGVAMCVHQGNYHEVEDMLRLAVDLGASCFAHFNFIPVGRGVDMAESDLDPQQREKLLRLLNDWMQSGRIGVLSTSPQFGRVCLAHAPAEGLQACSHAGSGAGLKARVVAKYLGGCGAGRTYSAIQPNGDVTPCVYMPDRVLGNVRAGSVADIFRSDGLWNLLCDRDGYTHHCRICEFRYYCGGCRARADAYFGRPEAGDPGCLFNARHWDDLVARRPVADPANTAPARRESLAHAAPSD